MKIDLEKMSRAELEELQVAVAAAIKTAGEREKQAAWEAAQAAALEHGFSLDELTVSTGRRGKGASKPKSPIRYRSKDDDSLTWSGRGRKPAWIKEAEANGVDIETFAV